MQLIGVGAYGKVWKGQCKKYKEIYAIKEMSKAKVAEKNNVKGIITEMGILTKLHHPFVMNLEFSFQDEDNLYLVSEYLPCGDLRLHFEKHKKFTELQLSN